MKVINFIFCLATVSFICGCSYLNLETEVGTINDISLETSYSRDDFTSKKAVYYYSQGEKVYLEERKDLVAFKFIDSRAEDDFLSSVSKALELRLLDFSEHFQAPYSTIDNILIFQSIKGDVDSLFFNELRSLEGIEFVSHPFENKGRLIVATDEFVVKVVSSSFVQQLLSIADEYKCTVYQKDLFSRDVFFVRCPKYSAYSTLQLADIFYETGLFYFSSPDFYLPDNYTTDPGYIYQWAWKNTGQHGYSGIDINIESAWNYTEGSEDVIVAILDTGVDSTHPDFVSNLISGYGSAVSSHGTAIAGEIAAIKDNGIGLAGVAPGCKIMSVYRGTTFSSAANGILWARNHGADVINCSWGAQNTTNDCLISEIYDAVTLGRAGKGCVVIAASGNENTSNVSFPACLTNVLSVGALSYDGKRKTSTSPDNDSSWGSNYGSGLNVMAPGTSIFTTGTSNSYFYFSGTSSAAPIVSGIAALIISLYPDLTQDQVRKAIEYSCNSISGYSYSYGYDYPFEPRYNSEVGRGRVNASEAIRIAGQMHRKNVDDTTPGFDVTILNNSFYTIEGIEVNLTGQIGGNEFTLFSETMGNVLSGRIVGYPVFRGPDIPVALIDATVEDIYLEMYAQCPSDNPGGMRIAVQMDNPYPTNFQYFSFGSGDFYELNLPDSTVPDNSRHHLYINILYP